MNDFEQRVGSYMETDEETRQRLFCKLALDYVLLAEANRSLVRNAMDKVVVEQNLRETIETLKMVNHDLRLELQQVRSFCEQGFNAALRDEDSANAQG